MKLWQCAGIIFFFLLATPAHSLANDQYLTSQISIAGRPWLFESSGNYLYVITIGSSVQADSNLTIIDASNPAALRKVSSVNIGRGAEGLTINGNYAYIARGSGGNGFTIVDIRDKANPMKLNRTISLRFPQYNNTTMPLGRVMSSKILGNYLYAPGYLGLNNQNDGIIIIDISDFNNWVFAGFAPTRAFRADVEGNYAYACETGTVKIYDISNKAAPVKVSEIDLNQPYSSSNTCKISGNTFHVASYASGFGIKVYDVTNKASPRLLRHIPVRQGFYTGNFAFKNNELFIPEQRQSGVLGRIRKYDAANPANIRLVSTIFFTQSTRNIKVVNGRLIISNAVSSGGREDTNIATVDEAGFQNRPPVSRADINRTITAYQQMRHQFRVDDPDQDNIFYRLNGAPAGVFVETGYYDDSSPNLVWTPDNNQTGTNRFTIIATDDFNNSVSINATITVNRGNEPSDPAQRVPSLPDTVVAANIPFDGYPSSLLVRENYLYAVYSKMLISNLDDSNIILRIYDISNPVAPRLLSAANYIGQAPHTSYISGNRLYMPTNEGVIVWDITNKSSPAKLRDKIAVQYSPNVSIELGRSMSVKILGSRFYSIGFLGIDNLGNGLLVADSDGNRWRKAGFFPTNSFRFDIMDNGNTGAICDTNKLTFIDVSNPSNIRERTHFDLNTFSAYSLFCQFSGNYLYVSSASPGFGFKVYDVSNPSAPLEVYSYRTQSWAGQFALGANNLFLREPGNAGSFDRILMFDITNPRSPVKIARRKSTANVTLGLAATQGYVFVPVQKEGVRSNPDGEGRSYVEYDGNVLVIAASEFRNRSPSIRGNGSSAVNTFSNIQANRLFSSGILASDIDGDPITYSLINAPFGMAIETDRYTSATVKWTPVNSQAGNYNVAVRASDDFNQYADLNIVISITSPGNRPPAIVTTSIENAYPRVPYTQKINYSEPDFGDSVSFSLAGAPEGMEIDSNGTITWLAQAGDIGPHDFNVEVSDSTGAGSEKKYTLVVVPNTVIGGSCLAQECTGGSLFGRQTEGELTFTTSEQELCRILNSHDPSGELKASLERSGSYYTENGVQSSPAKTNPHSEAISSVFIERLPKQVIVNDDFAYVLSNNSTRRADEYTIQARLDIFDVKNPYHPAKRSSIDFAVNEGIHSMDIYGDRIYLSTSDGIKSVYVSDKANPSFNGNDTSVYLPSTGYSITLSQVFSSARKGNILLMAGYLGINNETRGVIVADVSNDANWIRRGFYPTENGIGTVKISDTGDIGVLCMNGYFDIIGISDPANPSRLSRTNAYPSQYASITRCDLEGNTLAIARSERGMGAKIYDITDRASPRLTGHYNTSEPGTSQDAGWQAVDVLLKQGTVYVLEQSGLPGRSRMTKLNASGNVAGRANPSVMDLKSASAFGDGYVAALVSNPGQARNDGNLLIIPAAAFENNAPNYGIARNMLTILHKGYPSTVTVMPKDPDPDIIGYSFGGNIPQGMTFAVEKNYVETKLKILWDGGNSTTPGVYDVLVTESDDMGQSTQYTVFTDIKSSATSGINLANRKTDQKAVAGIPYEYDPSPEADGNAVYYLGTAPLGVSIDQRTARISWTPGPEQAGRHRIELFGFNRQTGKSVELGYYIDVAENPAFVENCARAVSQCSYQAITGMQSSENISITGSAGEFCSVLGSNGPVESLRSSVLANTLQYFFGNPLAEREDENENEQTVAASDKNLQTPKIPDAADQAESLMFDPQGNLREIEVARRLFLKIKHLVPQIAETENISIEVLIQNRIGKFSAGIENGELSYIRNAPAENPTLVIKTSSKVLERIRDAKNPAAELGIAIAGKEITFEQPKEQSAEEIFRSIADKFRFFGKLVLTSFVTLVPAKTTTGIIEINTITAAGIKPIAIACDYALKGDSQCSTSTGYYCILGKCTLDKTYATAKPVCSDSDNSEDISKAGTVTYSYRQTNGVYAKGLTAADTCTDTSTISELSCNTNVAFGKAPYNTRKILCPYGCLSGKCNSAPVIPVKEITPVKEIVPILPVVNIVKETEQPKEPQLSDPLPQVTQDRPVAEIKEPVVQIPDNVEEIAQEISLPLPIVQIPQETLPEDAAEIALPEIIPPEVISQEREELKISTVPEEQIICIQGTQQCAKDGNYLQKCISNQWINSKNCPLGCRDSACIEQKKEKKKPKIPAAKERVQETAKQPQDGIAEEPQIPSEDVLGRKIVRNGNVYQVIDQTGKRLGITTKESILLMQISKNGLSANAGVYLENIEGLAVFAKPNQLIETLVSGKPEELTAQESEKFSQGQRAADIARAAVAATGKGEGK